ncbi:PRC-barrel domain-containing protein [Phyllobacterium sp. SB3]|uniref:PRC-barrel domain-containing protein n=1 Tax=Phyllobacterium sp. SB3 TaxID=3156073 RepID=UPI0032AFFB10
MFRALIASTAGLALLSGVAMAQGTTTAPDPAPVETAPPAKVDTMELFKGVPADSAAADAAAMTKVEEGQLLGSGLIGKDVYNGDADDAESIGKLNDLIIGPDGKVQAAVISVGGFLGVGAKNVALPVNQLKLSVREDKKNWIVVDTTKDKLQEAPAFETADNFTEGVADPAKADEANSESAPIEPAPAAPATPDATEPATPTPPADTTAPADPAPAN